MAGLTDSGDPTLIQPSDLDPSTAPSSPQNGDFWYTSEGVTPNQVITLWLCVDGTSYVMSSITV
jgi:hypothetical protein